MLTDKDDGIIKVKSLQMCVGNTYYCLVHSLSLRLLRSYSKGHGDLDLPLSACDPQGVTTITIPFLLFWCDPLGGSL